MGETELVLDRMSVDEVMRMHRRRARRGNAPRGSGAAMRDAAREVRLQTRAV